MKFYYPQREDLPGRELVLERAWITKLVSVYKPVLFFVASLMLLLSVSRFFLVVDYWPRVDAVEGLLFVLLQGVRFDLIIVAALALLPALSAPFVFGRRIWSNLTQAYMVAGFTLTAFMEAATPTFIGEYDLRPNILFVEYLKYPEEVGRMLLGGYKLDIIVGMTVVLLLSFLFGKKLSLTYLNN